MNIHDYPSAIALIKELEGLRLDAYRCAAGVWTIGYGTTRLQTRPVQSGDRLPNEAHAEEILLRQLSLDYLPKLQIIPRWGQMTEYQQSALISFAYNLGASFYGSNGFETISKALRTNWEAVPAAIKLYNKAGGKTLAGLVRRRQAEADLWQRGLAIIENEGTPMDGLINQSIEVSALSAIALTNLQIALQKLGYYPGAIDGIFGKQTGQAWAMWKSDNFLGQTTMIGADSWQKVKAQADLIQIIDWSDFNCKISKYFTVGEATNHDKVRIPTRQEIQNNIVLLAKHLDKIREEWGSAIGVTSWYRPPAVNRAVGGASNSQHLYGKAADIYPIEGNIYDFQKWLDLRWDMALGYGAKKGFVHVDIRQGGYIRWNY